MTRFPHGLAAALGARWPGARLEGADVIVPGPPAARIRLTGEWRGEGAYAARDLLDGDPLFRAAHVLLGERFARAVNPQARPEPRALVEPAAAIPRGAWDRAARRGTSGLRRRERLRVSWQGDRPVVVASLDGLEPSRIEHRIGAALELLATLAGGA